MNFKLVTLLGIKIDKDVYEIIVPTSTGEIAIFPGHESLVTLAVPGEIAIRHKKEDSDDNLERLVISGGVIEINQKSVRILVDQADYGVDIIESEAKAAYERALELKKNATSQVELDRAHQLLDRHAVRLKVAELQRHRRR